MVFKINFHLNRSSNALAYMELMAMSLGTGITGLTYLYELGFIHTKLSSAMVSMYETYKYESSVANYFWTITKIPLTLTHDFPDDSGIPSKINFKYQVLFFPRMKASQQAITTGLDPTALTIGRSTEVLNTYRESGLTAESFNDILTLIGARYAYFFESNLMTVSDYYIFSRVSNNKVKTRFYKHTALPAFGVEVNTKKIQVESLPKFFLNHATDPRTDGKWELEHEEILRTLGIMMPESHNESLFVTLYKRLFTDSVASDVVFISSILGVFDA